MLVGKELQRLALILPKESPPQGHFGHPILSGPCAAWQQNCQLWVCMKNYQHLSLWVSTEPASLQSMKSPWQMCHITSLTSQRFSDPLSLSVVDLHMDNLWLLLIPAIIKYWTWESLGDAFGFLMQVSSTLPYHNITILLDLFRGRFILLFFMNLFHYLLNLMGGRAAYLTFLLWHLILCSVLV